MELFQFFSEFSGIASYLAVVGTLLICGLGFPIPEDIVLISGGFLAAHNGHGVWPMVLISLFGILGGDSLAYGMGRRFGIAIALQTPLRRFLTPGRLDRVDSLFRRHGEKILIAARFMPGVRAVAFFSAGAMRVPYWKFLLFDGLAALFSAPLWVILGYSFGQDVLEWAKRSQWVLVGIGVALVIAWLVFRLVQSRKSARVADGIAPVSSELGIKTPELPSPRLKKAESSKPYGAAGATQRLHP